MAGAVWRGADDRLGCLRVCIVRNGRRGAKRAAPVARDDAGFCGAGSRQASAVRLLRRVVPIGESPSGKASDFDSDIRRFDPYLPSQLSEQPPVAAVFVVVSD